jgi:hypothetical protein
MKSQKSSSAKFISTEEKVTQKIFKIRKYRRNGLLEKRIMQKNNILKSGRWNREENSAFIRACLKHGTKWKKVNNVI